VGVERPALRRDLAISRQEHRGRDVVVIKDPVCGDFFRVSADEFELLRLMDGRRGIDDIRQVYEERRQRSLAERRLAALIERVHRFGLFETSDSGGAGLSRRPRESRRFLAGDLLHLRFALVDPDAFLTRWIRKTRFFFSSRFVVPASACILAAVVLLPFGWGAYGGQLERLYRWQSVVLIWISVSAIVVIHELAHGLTCKHFGGQVREMGLGLVYFQPCLYTDVSDSYLFPERSSRLWVMLSGSFIQAFVLSLAVFAWWLVPGAGLVKDLCFVIVVVSGLGLLLNFNPLLKLDGYYVLVDLLGIPNLRAKSFAHLQRRLLGRRPRDSAADAVVLRDDEARIYVTYGLSAMVYSFLLLGFVAYLSIRLVVGP
jgi:putative peptide zinc metalloprotease protein